MEDIATAAGMSRPAVYQYVRNKDDIFRRLAEHLFQQVLVEARAGAEAGPELPDRLYGILAPKLAMTQRLFHDSPHATELVGENARMSPDLDLRFTAQLAGLVATALTDAGIEAGEAVEAAELAVALTRGLEADLSDVDRPRRRLRHGLALLVAGLTAAQH